MKRLLSSVCILILFLSQVSLAAECLPKNQDFSQFERICNNVDDIICKDVPKTERRGCSLREQTIVHKGMTASEVYSFAKGCFKSSVTSFKNFFTDFVPDLLSAMWKLLRGAGELTANSFSRNQQDVGWWGKMKGMYESSKSVAVDVYEAAQQSPGEFMSNIWDKMVDAVGPMVASYDCLKPQVKVEKICGFVAGWVLPPAMFAKLLIKGSKFVKEVAVAGNAKGVGDKLKLQKMLEAAEKRPKISMQEYQAYYERYKTLGYTDEEVAALYKSGDLTKVKIQDIKPKVTTKSAASKLTLSERKIVRETMGSEFVSLEAKTSQGKTVLVPAHVAERIIEGSDIIKYRLSYVDPKTGLIKEFIATEEVLAGLKVAPGNAKVSELFLGAAAKDPAYKDPAQEFERLLKEPSKKPAQPVVPAKEVKVEGMEVKELSHDEYQKMLQGNEAIEFKLDDASKAQAAQAREAIKKKIEAENAQAKYKRMQEAAAEAARPKGKAIVSSMSSNYVMINTKNSMGINVTTPVEIVKKITESGREKLIIRTYDTTTKTVKESTITEAELKMMKPRESDSAAKAIEQMKKEVPMGSSYFDSL